MLKLKSMPLRDYYGEYPYEYYIRFVHYNIYIAEDTTEDYKNIKEDLEKIYNFDPKAFKVYFSDIVNFEKFINNIEVNYFDKIYLRIRTINEYNKLKKINVDKNIKLIVDIKDIEKFNITDYNIVIQIDKVSELSIKKLKDLLKKYKIKEILLGQIPYLTKEDDALYDMMSKMYNINAKEKLSLEKINKITNDIYGIDDYIKILDKFNKVIDELNIDNKVDGIYKIFDYIVKKLHYDDEGVKETKIENQNLIGPVLNNIGTCEGYSKYLQQLLSLIDVDSIVVMGGNAKDEGGHIWNQIKLNDNWYNADVVAASYAKSQNKNINTCLVKDSNLLYETDSSISYKCNIDYKPD